MNLDFPLGFDGRGRSAATTPEEHVRDLIEQVLFTSPGERVMRPDFGSGLMQLVFAPVGGEIAAATQMLVQSSLQHWLGDLIDVEAVDASFDDGVLSVSVQYTLRQSGERAVAEFARPAT